jgi:hypothetical protein
VGAQDYSPRPFFMTYLLVLLYAWLRTLPCCVAERANKHLEVSSSFILPCPLPLNPVHWQGQKRAIGRKRLHKAHRCVAAIESGQQGVLAAGPLWAHANQA